MARNVGVKYGQILHEFIMLLNCWFAEFFMDVPLIEHIRGQSSNERYSVFGPWQLDLALLANSDKSCLE